MTNRFMAHSEYFTLKASGHSQERQTDVETERTSDHDY